MSAWSEYEDLSYEEGVLRQWSAEPILGFEPNEASLYLRAVCVNKDCVAPVYGGGVGDAVRYQKVKRTTPLRLTAFEMADAEYLTALHEKSGKRRLPEGQLLQGVVQYKENGGLRFGILETGWVRRAWACLFSRPCFSLLFKPVPWREDPDPSSCTP